MNRDLTCAACGFLQGLRFGWPSRLGISWAAKKARMGMGVRRGNKPEKTKRTKIRSTSYESFLVSDTRTYHMYKVQARRVQAGMVPPTRQTHLLLVPEPSLPHRRPRLRLNSYVESQTLQTDVTQTRSTPPKTARNYL